MLHSQKTREAHLYDNGNTRRCRKGRSKTVKLRSEEVESNKVGSDASGKDQVDVWSERSEGEPVNVAAGCAGSESEPV